MFLCLAHDITKEIVAKAVRPPGCLIPAKPEHKFEADLDHKFVSTGSRLCKSLDEFIWIIFKSKNTLRGKLNQNFLAILVNWFDVAAVCFLV